MIFKYGADTRHACGRRLAAGAVQEIPRTAFKTPISVKLPDMIE